MLCKYASYHVIKLDLSCSFFEHHLRGFLLGTLSERSFLLLIPPEPFQMQFKLPQRYTSHAPGPSPGALCQWLQLHMALARRHSPRNPEESPTKGPFVDNPSLWGREYICVYGAAEALQTKLHRTNYLTALEHMCSIRKSTDQTFV